MTVLGSYRKPTERGAATLAFGTPERLVGVGFRCWLAGYRSGNVACWQIAWQAYAEALGSSPAKDVTCGLARWVRTISACASRPIETWPPGCRGFCRDEQIAIAMVAASQHRCCPALQMCAATLIGCDEQTDEVIAAAGEFAWSLLAADQRLAAASLGVLDCACELPPPGVPPH
jgi:hypothetical protein